MIANFNVKVQAGKRTPIHVTAIATSVNTKILTMPNGKTITDQQIAMWIQRELKKVLEAYNE